MRSAETDADSVTREIVKTIRGHFQLPWHRWRGGRQRAKPAPLSIANSGHKGELPLGRLGTIGGTAALTLAIILALAAVVTRFTSALPFARVLTLTSVLFFDFICVLILRLSVECGIRTRE